MIGRPPGVHARADRSQRLGCLVASRTANAKVSSVEAWYCALSIAPQQVFFVHLMREFLKRHGKRPVCTSRMKSMRPRK